MTVSQVLIFSRHTDKRELHYTHLCNNSSHSNSFSAMQKDVGGKSQDPFSEHLKQCDRDVGVTLVCHQVSF